MCCGPDGLHVCSPATASPFLSGKLQLFLKTAIKRDINIIACSGSLYETMELNLDIQLPYKEELLVCVYLQTIQSM